MFRKRGTDCKIEPEKSGAEREERKAQEVSPQETAVSEARIEETTGDFVEQAQNPAEQGSFLDHRFQRYGGGNSQNRLYFSYCKKS